MKTLVFYDNEGKIFHTLSGTYDKPNGGIQYIEVEIPEGKMLVSIDTSNQDNHTPVYEDIPEDDFTKRLSQLEEENKTLANTLDDILTNVIPSLTNESEVM